MTLEQKVLAYLTMILYPPVSKKFLPAAVQAILSAREGDYIQKINISKNRYLKVEQILDMLLLHHFVDQSEMDPYLDHIIIEKTKNTKDKIAYFISKTVRSLSCLIATVIYGNKE